MRFALLFAASLLASQSAGNAADPTIPANASVVLTVEGIGVQIYRCTQQDPAYSWTFQSPEATLSDPATHRQTGTHGAGPTWTLTEGRSITGKVLQKMPAPRPNDVPWLLLEAKPANTIPGALSGIQYVRRSDTLGGAAPATGCNAVHRDSILRVPYTATYTFYKAMA